MTSSQAIYLKTKSIDDVDPGDLIQITRAKGLYAHWTVYVGNGDVIHLSPPPSGTAEMTELCSAIAASSGVSSSSSGKLFANAKVRRDALDVVSNGSARIVNNECDDEMRPFSGQEIVKRAKSKLGTNDYNLFTWNCEHFATWCRYGTGVSKQAGTVAESLSANAYLVQLPGAQLVPQGSLPANMFAA